MSELRLRKAGVCICTSAYGGAKSETRPPVPVYLSGPPYATMEGFGQDVPNENHNHAIAYLSGIERDGKHIGTVFLVRATRPTEDACKELYEKYLAYGAQHGINPVRLVKIGELAEKEPHVNVWDTVDWPGKSARMPLFEEKF